MLSELIHESYDSPERELPSPRRARPPERVRTPPERVRTLGGEALHIWTVGFSGSAAERVQRSCERVGRLARRFGDCWRLAQYVMPCFGGALVRRPDLLIVNADQLSQHDLDWLQELGGPLPILKIASSEALAEGEAALAQRLRTAARSFAQSVSPSWP